MALGGSTPKRYAEALLDLAVQQGALEEWRASLERVSASLSADVFRLLASPAYPLAARRQALERATAGEPAGIRSLLVTLLERERIALLPAIARSFYDLLDARAGIEKATITTSAPLDERERAALVERLERDSGKRLRATFETEPDLGGGMLVRIGDHQIDGSVRTRLALLRDRLATG